MAAALDPALERGARMQKEKEEGQTNLFAVLTEQEADMPISWPDVPEWRESVRLAYEKESLGFYITGHPLAKYEQELAALTNANAEKIKEMPDKSVVRIGGVVSKVQLKMTKKGDRMAFVTLEDMAGMVEIIVFPELYQASQEFFGSGQALTGGRGSGCRREGRFNNQKNPGQRDTATGIGTAADGQSHCFFRSTPTT